MSFNQSINPSIKFLASTLIICMDQYTTSAALIVTYLTQREYLLDSPNSQHTVCVILELQQQSVRVFSASPSTNVKDRSLNLCVSSVYAHTCSRQNSFPGPSFPKWHIMNVLAEWFDKYGEKITFCAWNPHTSSTESTLGTKNVENPNCKSVIIFFQEQNLTSVSSMTMYSCWDQLRYRYWKTTSMNGLSSREQIQLSVGRVVCNPHTHYCWCCSSVWRNTLSEMPTTGRPY